MKLTDFADLATAQAYSEPKKRMISQDMVMSFLTIHDSILSLQTATSGYAQGFWLAVTSGVKEFNVMADHPVGEAQRALLNALVTEGAVTASFRDACFSYANEPNYPFANATQEDWDKQVSLDNPTVNILVNENPLVKGTRERLHQIDVELEAIPYDDVITVYAESKNNGDAGYSLTPTPVGTLRVEPNEFGKRQITINKILLKNQIRYYLSSKHNRTLTANTYLNG